MKIWTVCLAATRSTPRFVTTTRPVTFRAPKRRTSCPQTVASSKAKWRTVFCSVASELRKVPNVKNCVLMQDTIVGEGANVEYVITDKNVTISAGKEIKGADSFPVYVAKYRSV